MKILALALAAAHFFFLLGPSVALKISISATPLGRFAPF